MIESVDVAVLGAGPAGATIARLLAEWGCSVLLLAGSGPRQLMAETVPALGAEIAPGFYRATGATVWWAGEQPEIRRFDPCQWHVDRRAYDAALLESARAAGAEILPNRRAPVIELSTGEVTHDGGQTRARFVVDASGRAGLIARQIRRFWDTRYQTMAVCAVVRAAQRWPFDPHHAVAEAYEHGWACSVPLAPEVRQVVFMVDAGRVRTGPGELYRGELGATEHVRKAFEACEFVEIPWTRDASLYHAERYAGPNWLLVGDAGSFADLVSSAGVERAISSARAGAEMIRTCLDSHDRASGAIDQFNARQSNNYQQSIDSATARFAECARVFAGSFWQARAR